MISHYTPYQFNSCVNKNHNRNSQTKSNLNRSGSQNKCCSVSFQRKLEITKSEFVIIHPFMFFETNKAKNQISFDIQH